MKIKEIKMCGFKSFPGECKLSLNAGITSFVGPNGSGKSNIFDALRWVFGEQSMKTLRCERIEDLIYVSADAQNDANFAEVTATIDNEDFFPQFGAELEIRRRFFRNGESEFFLNRAKCRLQDIQALFLNSGTLTYSFLELSEIERIIHGETKEMFDDVSGILKYQERREQTRRRLEVTGQDLLRLEDIIHEMQRSLRNLKRQVRQTRLFQELREEYRRISLYLLKDEFEKSEAEIVSLRQQLLVKENERQAITQQIRTLEANREQIKNEMKVYETRKDEIVGRLEAMNEQITQLERRIDDEREKGNLIRLARERMLASIHEKEEVLKTSASRLAEYRQQIAEAEDAYGLARQSVESSTSRIEESNQRFFLLQDKIKRSRAREEELIDQRADLDPVAAKLHYEKENAEAMLEKLSGEYQTHRSEIDSSRRTLEQADEELNLMIARQDELTGSLDALNLELKSREANLHDIEKDLEERRTAYNDCKLQIDTRSQRLKEKGMVREITEKIGLKHGRLMQDYLRVDQGYEAVVDICLGDILQYYVVEELGETTAKDLPDGRYGFLNVTNKLESGKLPEESEKVTPMRQFVGIKDFKEALSYYIDRYYLAGSFDQAQRLSIEYPQFGFVTSDGVLFREGSIIVERGDIGYFRISQTLEEQRRHLETIKNEIGFCENEKNRLKEEIGGMRSAVEHAKAELFTVNVRKSECSLQRNEINRSLGKVLKEHERLEAERYALRKFIESCAGRIQEHESKIQDIEDEIKTNQQDRRSLEADAGILQSEIEQLSGELNEYRIGAVGFEERLIGVKAAAGRLHDDIVKMSEELDALKQDDAARQLVEIDGTVKRLGDECSQKKIERRNIEAEMPQVVLKDLTERLNRVFDDLALKQKAHEDVQNEIMQLKYSGFQAEHRKDDVVKKSREEFRLDLADFRIEEKIDNADSRLIEVRGKIEKLGEVNPLSLELFENERKRLDEYLSQRDDIITAKRSLLNSIAELDTRAKERFFDIFDRVKEEFNFVFANFFEGGQADLLLTDPDNPLTSKVDIVVRMKGKRPKKITQLSGGERTLLAISLLLAFYLVKPAPFCILDEIDAPLDDANVVRFNRFLRDLSQRTQVIIITHNRATMEYADYIYGLTMERPGQSKVISARLADLEGLDAT